MTKTNFPALPLVEWQPSRDTIHQYARVIGKIRQALAPPQKHWWHISLRAAATGLTTTPIRVGSMTFELRLDFISHHLVVTTSHGERWHKPLRGQSVATFCEETLAYLAGLDIQPEIDRTLFEDTSPGSYQVPDVERFWQAFSQIDAIFKRFKGELRAETSPVQLWPHHFDLAMLWLSGRRVPGVDPEDEEQADEQMNFGFATGDETIPEPYFYITAYPLPDGLAETPLPAGITWQTAGFTGALLTYEALVAAADPAETLLTYLRTVQQAGATLMRSKSA